MREDLLAYQLLSGVAHLTVLAMYWDVKIDLNELIKRFASSGPLLASTKSTSIIAPHTVVQQTDLGSRNIGPTDMS